MKKIFLITILSITNLIFAQYITGLSVTQNGTNQIKTNLKVYLPTVGEFKNYQVNINQSTITLSACYFMTDFGGISNLENNFLIDITDNNNYTLIVKMYSSTDPTNCNYTNLEDTATLNFTTPIEGTVSLATDETENSGQNIQLFPNPAKDILNIITDSKIQNVKVYDASGRLFSARIDEKGKIDISSLKNGTYFIEILTYKKRFHRKFIIQK